MRKVEKEHVLLEQSTSRHHTSHITDDSPPPYEHSCLGLTFQIVSPTRLRTHSTFRMQTLLSSWSPTSRSTGGQLRRRCRRCNRVPKANRGPCPSSNSGRNWKCSVRPGPTTATRPWVIWGVPGSSRASPTDSAARIPSSWRHAWGAIGCCGCPTASGKGRNLAILESTTNCCALDNELCPSSRFRWSMEV